MLKKLLDDNNGCGVLGGCGTIGIIFAGFLFPQVLLITPIIVWPTVFFFLLAGCPLIPLMACDAIMPCGCPLLQTYLIGIINGLAGSPPPAHPVFTFHFP